MGMSPDALLGAIMGVMLDADSPVYKIHFD